jgi:hypothetical protein
MYYAIASRKFERCVRLTDAIVGTFEPDQERRQNLKQRCDHDSEDGQCRKQQRSALPLQDAAMPRPQTGRTHRPLRVFSR